MHTGNWKWGVFRVVDLIVISVMILSNPLTVLAASGDFSIDFVAAAPYSYNHLTGGGAYDDRTVGTNNGDIVESLEGGDFACGDIVTYFVAVTVDNTAQAAADAPQTIEMDFSFLADTTGQSGAALGDIVYVGVNYGTIQDLVAGENTVDDGIMDDGGSTATLTNEYLDGTIFVDGVLHGTVVLTDLEQAEQVVVRIDVKLFCQPGSDPTGNLQADLQSASLTYINGGTAVTPPQAIPGGAQTVPFKQIGDMVAPAIDIQKTVTTVDGTCPGAETQSIYAGDTVKYCYVVTNPSNTIDPPGAPLYDVSLIDDNGTPANTTDDFTVTLTGLIDLDMDGLADDLAEGGSAFGSALVTLYTVGTVVNTATATGFDSIVYPTAYTDTDTASVTVQPPPVVAPMPRVIKGNAEGNDTVATLNEPGGSATINVVVYNDAAAGTGDATLTTLVDDIYGDITTTGHNGITATTCATGGVIAGGGSYSCSFTVSITSEPATIHDTVSATLQNTHSSVSDTDDANVVISNVMPTVNLVKDVAPATLPEPGGAFNYTLTVYNTSAEPVTITALTDDNALPEGCTGLIGQTIAVGGSLSCQYSVTHTAPGTYPNTASVTVQDNDGSTASDTDTETVTVTDVMPTVDLTKTAQPLTYAEPGGVFTFTLSVTNTSIEPVTITDLTDTNTLSPECQALVGTSLAVGETASCTYTVTQTEPGSYDNTASVTVEDNEGNAASDTDSETVTVTNVAPDISVTKTASPTSVPETGGNVTFTFVVSNIGVEDVTLTSLTDTVFGDLNGQGDCVTGGVIPVGGSYSCQITVFLSSDSLTDHYNVVTAVGTDNDGTTDTATDNETVTFTDVAPDITITKTAAPTSVPETGGNVTFTFLVENVGVEDVTLTSLSDSVFGDLNGQGDCVTGGLIPVSGSYSCSITVWLEAGDLADHYNVVTAVGTDDDGTTDTATDDETVTFSNVAPDITITKTANPNSVPETGGNVTFTFVVSNIGVEDVTLTSLTDTVFGDLNEQGDCVTGGLIPVGGSYSCSITQFLSSDSLMAHYNVVTAVGTDNDGSTDTATDEETVTFTDVAPDISITKTADPASVPETGGNVTFTFLVENIGVEDVTLTSLSDSVFGDLNGQGDCTTGGVIPAGGSYTCSITQFLASDSLTAHTNVVTAVGTDDDGTTDTATDEETVTFDDVAPDIAVTKVADPTSVPETGGEVTFTFVVSNIGVEDVTLTSLTDTVFGDLNGQGTCETGGLIPVGSSYNCSITAFLAADDLVAHYNVVTAVGTDDDGTTDTATDDETVTFRDVAPEISITKSADPSSVPETGGNVTFTFLVENIGVEDVTLTSLTDSVFGDLNGQGTCTTGGLIPVGGSYSCSFSTFLSSDSLTDHNNVVTAVGTDDDGTTDTGTDNETVTFEDVAPVITITKTADPTHVPETGGNVTFTFLVENTGQEDVTLTSLSDTKFGDLDGKGTCIVPQVILIGGSYSCAYTVFLSSDSLTAHTNVVTATAVDDDNTPATDDDDETVTFDDVAPMIRITKTADPTQVPETGGDVIFTFLVENIGQEDVTLTSLSDTVFGDLNGQGDCIVPQTILIGGSYSCSITQFLASDSLTAHTNVVTASAVDDDNTPATDDDDETVTFNDVAPDIAVTKVANPTSVPETGEDVTFTFVVSNIGVEDVTLTSLTDTVFGDLNGQGTCETGGLIPVGSSYNCSITAFLAADDLVAHYNVVTAVGTDDDGTADTATDDEKVTFRDVAPDITITKSANPNSVLETGGNVTFTFLVENIGVEDVTLTSLTDSVFGDLNGQGTCTTGGLIPVGGSYSCSFSTSLSSDSLTDHFNVVTAVGTDDDGTTDTATDDETVTFLDVAPTIEIIKTADPTHVSETGGNVTFTFVVNNIGLEDVTLTSLTDTLLGDLDGKGTCDVPQEILIGGSYSCTYTVFLSSDSLTSHTNVVTATAEDDDGTTATDDDDETVTFDDVLPDIAITKTANPTSVPETGGNVAFTIVVTNNSLEAATIDSLVDSDFDLAAHCPDAVGTVLGYGETYTCTFTEYIAGDYESGVSHVNTATAVASDNDGNSDTASDDATVSFTDVTASIDVEKLVSVDGGTTWIDADSPTGPYVVEGDPVQFKFVVTNTGSVALGSISLTDSDFNLAGCTIPATLAAGAWFECAISTTAVLGQHTNTAAASGSFTDGAGNTETDTDADDANYYGMMKGQPSIQIESLSININSTRTSVTGQFYITDQSTSAKQPDGYMVAITTYGVRWEQKSAAKKSIYEPVIPSGCTYTIVAVDNQQVAGWQSGDPIIFDESVTIGYTCTFGSTQLSKGGTLKGTAYAGIFGRTDREFTFSNTALIPK